MYYYTVQYTKDFVNEELKSVLICERGYLTFDKLYSDLISSDSFYIRGPGTASELDPLFSSVLMFGTEVLTTWAAREPHGNF